MAIKAPTTDQIVEVGAQLGIHLSEDEAAQYLAAMQPMLAGYGDADSMADELPEVRCPRVPGHPALTIPCGLGDGLPVGLQLTGRHFDEATVYRGAHAFKQSVDWKTL